MALLIMSVLAGMAWQGVDVMLRTKNITDKAVKEVMQLNTAVAQLEADLQASYDYSGYPAVSFDGMNLRIVRQSIHGVQVVVWAARQGLWQRWASTPEKLREAFIKDWQSTQMQQGNEPGWSVMARGIEGWRVFCFRGTAWTNCMSTGDRTTPSQPPILASGNQSSKPLEKKPLALQIVIGFKKPDGEPPVELVRKLMLTGVD